MNLKTSVAQELSKSFMNHKKHKKITAFLASLAAFAFVVTTYIFILPAITLETDEDSSLLLTTAYSLELYPESSDPDPISITMKDTERICLSANDTLLGSWDWQIYSFDEDTWFSFYNENQSSIVLYDAKLSNMLTASQQALVRLKAVIEGVSYQSPCVQIQMEATVSSSKTESTSSAENTEAETVFEDFTNQDSLVEEDESVYSEPVWEWAEEELLDESWQMDSEPEDVQEDIREDTEEQTEVPYQDLEGQTDSEPEEQSLQEEQQEEEWTASLFPLTSTRFLNKVSVLKDEEPDNSNGLNTFTVTIQFYVLKNGEKQLRNTYTAQVSAEYDLSKLAPTVESIAGYTPYFVTDSGETEITGSALTLTGTVESNLEYEVVYKPALTNYTIEYWTEVLGQTGVYELAESETKQGYTDSQVTDPQRTFEGFKARSYELPEIAADGSTVLKIEYDRQFYKLIFNLDGGSGISTDLYGQYGQAVSIANPIKAGYTFDGWYEDAEFKTPAALPSAIPAQNCTFYAKWIPSETTYAIFIWIDSDGTSQAKEYVGSILGEKGTSETEITYDNVKESVEEYLTLKGLNTHYTAASSESVVLKGDGSTNFNVYLQPKTYLLRFVYARSYVSNNNTIWQISRSNTGTADGTTAWSYDTTDNAKADLDLHLYWVTTQNNTPVTLSSDFQQTINDSDGKLRSGTFAQTRSVTTWWGSTTSTEYTYYYIDLVAEWDENISDLWPVNPFGDTTITAGNASYSFISWGTYSGTPYRGLNSSGNPNINGAYISMDEYMVIDGNDSVTVNGDDIAGEPCQYFAGYWNDNTKYTYTYNIYMEALDQDLNSDEVIKEYNGKKYVLYETQEDVLDTDANLDHQNPHNYQGLEVKTAQREMETDPTKNGNKGVINFYCERTVYTLTLYNGYDTKIEVQVPFGAKFDSYQINSYTIKDSDGETKITLEDAVYIKDLLPIYPSKSSSDFEEGEYAFSNKWYLDTAADESGNLIYSEDLLYDFQNGEMEAKNLSLTGKWEICQIEIRFWKDETLINQEPAADTQSIAWGTAPIRPDNPEWGSKKFKAWYYYTDSTEPETDEYGNTVVDEQGNTVYKKNLTQLSFGTTTFTKDTDVFAMWDEDFYMDYKIHFVTYIDGQRVQIADDIEDHAKASSTVTVAAKTGNQLYSDYQSNYYPEVESTSLVMDSTKPEGTVFEFEFVYRYAENIPYQVKYLKVKTDTNGDPVIEDGNYVTEQELFNKTVLNNEYAVVTETYLANLPNYGKNYVLADSNYQITKTLTYPEGIDNLDEEAKQQALLDANTITFYYIYTENPVEYTVNYWTQKLNGDYENKETIQAFGRDGDMVQAIEKDFSGYRYNSEKSITTSGVLTSGGVPLVLNLYYDAMPVTLTKSWNGLNAQTVTFTIYTVDSLQNATEYSQDSTVSLSETENWTKTIYLPWPEDNQTYALVEQSGSWKTDYSPSQTIFISSKETKAALIASADQVNVQIKNSQTFALPSTGGSERIFKTGLLLSAGAAAALGVLKADQKRRKIKKRKQHKRH